MKYIKNIVFVVVLLAIGYFLLPYVKFSDNSGQKPSQDQNSGQQANSDTVKTFSSESFGARFEYNTDQDSDGKADTDAKEAGDKIYVYYTAAPMEQGQWVQKFSKDPKDTLTSAVQKRFLADYSSKDCYPLSLADYYKSYDANPPVLPPNVEVAVIAYPKTTDPNLPFWQNADKCPAVYTATGGAAYFWTDTQHPDKYFYFSIGQYAIFADAKNEKAWQDTFKVIN